ncbi:peptidyl-prolyl cis-trans isomerase [Proteiniclasticum sp. C24MP]|uniref:peptidyl-prolyl cis-trans isomerase n=1 Tax=Proteiniclasticum sp. C24MP TaxID=3374101 RepID=UPI003754A870
MISLKKKVLTTLSVSVLAIALAGCGLVEETPESIEGTVLAEVGDEKITQKDVDAEAVSYMDSLKVTYGEDILEQEEGKEVVKQLKVDILNSLVEMRIIDKKVEESGMETDTEEITKAIEERIEQVKAAYQAEEGAYEKALEDAGFTEESYYEFVKEDVIRQNYYVKLMEDVTVTEEDIKAYYEENKAAFMTPAGANIYHIYFGTDDAAKAEAEEVLKMIKEDGKDFAEAAEEFGNDMSAEAGGLLGYYAYDNQELYADFMDHVKVLEENEISDVVKSSAGYHIIKVDTVQKEAVQQSLEEVEVAISSNLQTELKNEKYAASMEEWKEEYNVKIYEDKIR